MKLDLFNINEFVKANHVQEVTNPIFFNPDKTPTEDGLFSYEIFGVTESERKNTFGYIDLGGKFIHPFIYAIFPRIGSFGKIVSGERYAVVADGKIVIVDEDFKGAETGIDFFYNNFDDIDWKSEADSSSSMDRQTRYEFFSSLNKNEFFIDKWLVLPPFYRAESSTDRSLGDNINKLYKDLISKCRSMKLGFSFNLFGNETKLKIQNLLKTLYQSTLSPVSGKHVQSDGSLKGSGKNSMIRKNLLGKSLDFSASNVITAPQVSLAESPDKTPVPFGYGRFPMPTLLALFQPFFVNEIVTILEARLREFANDNALNIKKIDLGQFSTTYAEKLIKKYVKTESERFEKITIEFTGIDDKKKVALLNMIFFESEQDAREGKNPIIRQMTATDLLYIAAKEIAIGKHVYVTRYPVINFQNIYPSRVKIASTRKTKEVWIRDRMHPDPIYYEDYPSTPDRNSQSDCRFVDVMVIGNVVLDSLGGDFDGDMVYMKAVFSNEANEEADRLIYSKTNILGADGKPTRGLGKMKLDPILALYELTKN